MMHTGLTICLSCSSASPSGKRFCADCGAPLPRICADCGGRIAQGSEVCGECRADPRANLPAKPSSPPERTAAATSVSHNKVLMGEAERRQLSVMFCDLVGSTSLAGRLDPEDMRDIIISYQNAVAAIVEKYGGYVAKYMGDGVLVLFGYPHAQEDDPEQAVRTGLAIVAAVSALSKPEPLQVRIGIATGLTVVGDLIGIGSSREQAVVGDTPNLAARLQALAEPNTVFISDTTRRLVGTLFALRDLGPQSLKGIAAEERVWQALREQRGAGRFQALRSSATTLLGRDAELLAAQEQWDLAKRGAGRLLIISGEPGIGKSRFAEALHRFASKDDFNFIRLDCSPAHTSSAFYPIIETLLKNIGGDEQDDFEIFRVRFVKRLRACGLSSREISSICGFTFSRRNQNDDVHTVSSSRKREMFVRSVVVYIAKLAEQVPLLMTWEDVHWADPSSLEFIAYLANNINKLPTMLVTTSRPELDDRWQALPCTHVLRLSRLDDKEAADLVRNVAFKRDLSDDLVSAVVGQADGVPLFIEELAKSVVEGLHSPIQRASIPTTLQATLTARLDRLGESRTIAQIASVIGRKFSFDLLLKVSGVSSSVLQDRLAFLESCDLMYRTGIQSENSYVFKHALVCDAAYNMLLRVERIRIHERVVRALEHSAHFTADHPNVLADHCAGAHLWVKAIRYWIAASRLAIGQFAHQEASQYHDRALAVLDQIPDPAVKRGLQVQLHLVCADIMRTTRGWSAQETFLRLQRARALVDSTTPSDEKTDIICGVWGFEFTNGRPRSALDFLESAADLIDADNQAFVTYMKAASRHNLGLFQSAIGDFESVLIATKLHAAAGMRAFGYGVAPVARSCLCQLYYLTGCFEAAEEAKRSALADARQLDHPVTLANVYALILPIVIFLGDLPFAHQLVDMQTKIAQMNGLDFFKHRADIFGGWLTSLEADPTRGADQIICSLEAGGRQGHAQHRPFYMMIAAQAFVRGGDFRRGVALAAQALREAEGSQERVRHAEIYRIYGDILSHEPRHAGSEAASYFERALKIASDQGAKTLQYLAVRSLEKLKSQYVPEICAKTQGTQMDYECFKAVFSRSPYTNML